MTQQSAIWPRACLSERGKSNKNKRFRAASRLPLLRLRDVVYVRTGTGSKMTIRNLVKQIIDGEGVARAASRAGRVLLVLAVAFSLTGAKRSPYGPHDKAAYTSPVIIDFLRPGLAITI